MDICTPLLKINDTVITGKSLIDIFCRDVYGVPVWLIILGVGLIYTNWSLFLKAKSLQEIILVIIKSPLIFIEKLIDPLLIVSLFLIILIVLWWLYTHLGLLVALVSALLILYFFVR